MRSADIAAVAAAAPLAPGYRFELLIRDEVTELIANLESWYRDISVGVASGFLQEQFYSRRVFFEDARDRECVVLTLKCSADLVGVFACEVQQLNRSIYAALGVTHPRHHGSNLGQAGMVFVEALARLLKMEFIFGTATLKHPYAQRACERAGWQLVGILPGYDRELVAPSVVKRVFEALYVKILDPDTLLYPELANLTPRTRALFDSLFSR